MHNYEELGCLMVLLSSHPEVSSPFTINSWESRFLVMCGIGNKWHRKYIGFT